MPLFRCVNCNHVDNTACSNYWADELQRIQDSYVLPSHVLPRLPVLCSLLSSTDWPVARQVPAQVIPRVKKPVVADDHAFCCDFDQGLIHHTTPRGQINNGKEHRCGDAQDELAWLIEGVVPARRAGDVSETVYWKGGIASYESFTPDPNQAIRFSRKVDAESVINDLLVVFKAPCPSTFVPDGLTAVEHMWMGKAKWPALIDGASSSAARDQQNTFKRAWRHAESAFVAWIATDLEHYAAKMAKKAFRAAQDAFDEAMLGVVPEPVGNDTSVTPAAATSQEIARLKRLIVLGVEGWGHAELAEAQAILAETCSCGGRRFVEDECWQPTTEPWDGTRTVGDGLIPCALCNEGGWDTPVGVARPIPPAAAGSREDAK